MKNISWKKKLKKSWKKSCRKVGKKVLKNKVGKKC